MNEFPRGRKRSPDVAKWCDLASAGLAEIGEGQAYPAADATVTTPTSTHRSPQRTDVAQGAAVIAVLRSDGRIMFVNRPFLALAGLRREMVDGVRFEDLPCWPTKDGARHLLRERIRAFITGRQVRRVFEVRYPDGVRGRIELRIHPVHDQAGQVEHLVVEGREAVADSAGELGTPESLARHVTRAHRMETLGQMTTGIAHDFNNILAAILGYVRLVQDSIDHATGHDPRGYLSEVINAADRGRELIDQLLAFSRGDDTVSSGVGIDGLIKNVIRMLRATLPASIHIELQLPDTLPTLTVDRVQFQQALMNLCINARDAMQETGRIDVGVYGRWTEQACMTCGEQLRGEYLAVCVRDTGPGIDPDVLDRIFEPFFTTKTAANGTGIGLSVVDACAHQVQGHVTVDNRPGHGCEICMYFPINAATTAAQEVTDAYTNPT